VTNITHSHNLSNSRLVPRRRTHSSFDPRNIHNPFNNVINLDNDGEMDNNRQSLLNCVNKIMNIAVLLNEPQGLSKAQMGNDINSEILNPSTNIKHFSAIIVRDPVFLNKLNEMRNSFVNDSLGSFNFLSGILCDVRKWPREYDEEELTPADIR
jgi:hypothetical protein